jgi:hypothetical protein
MRRFIFSIILVVAASSQADLPPIRGLSRSDLLEYRDDAGSVKKASTPSEWEKRRREALDGFLSMTGPLPSADQRCALDMQLEEETDCGSYVRRLISYESSPGGRVPAHDNPSQVC